MRNYLLRLLTILYLVCGITFLLLGVVSIISPKLIFQQLILPLANYYSQVGYIREEKTIILLWKEWINFGIYLINSIGIMLLVFIFILYKYQKRSYFYNESILDNFEGVKLSIKNLVYIFLIITIGIFLRCININQSLWSDEIGTVKFATLFRWWRYIELGDHWLYTFLTYININLFGQSEWIIRIPAFVFAVITIPFIYYFTRSFFSEKEAILSSFFLCFSSFHIQYSTEARGYSMLSFFSLVSSLLFLKLIERNSKFYLILFVISTMCGMLSHFYYTWIIFTQYCVIVCIFIMEEYLYRKRIIFNKDKVANIFLGISLGILFAFFIYGPDFIPSVIKKYISWKGTGEKIDFATFAHLLIGRPHSLWGIFFAVLLLYMVLDLFKKKQVILFFYFIFLGLPFLIVAKLCKNAYVAYFIYALPFLILGLSHSISILINSIFLPHKKIIFYAFMIIFIILQLPTLIFHYSHYKMGFQDYRSVGKLLDNYAQEDDVIYAIGIGNEATQYYTRKHRVIYELDEYKFVEQINNKNKIWLIVTFPEYIANYPQAKRIYEIAVQRLRLFRYFPGMRSDILVYTN